MTITANLRFDRIILLPITQRGATFLVLPFYRHAGDLWGLIILRVVQRPVAFGAYKFIIFLTFLDI